MAGRGRYIYIQDDIDEKLQKAPNKSKLINDLLREFFDKEDLNQMNAKQIRAEIEIRGLQKEHDKKLKEIRNNGNR